MDDPLGWHNPKLSHHPTDVVDWNERWRRNPPDEWHLGHRRRRQKLVEQFGRASTVHGAAYVCSSGRRNSSTCVKIIYRILFVFCFLAVINNVSVLLQDSLSKKAIFINSINRDTETGIEEDPDYFPRFPRITICRRPFYRTDFNTSYLHLVEYVMLTFGFPFIPLTPQQVALAVELVQNQLQMNDELTDAAVDFRDRLKLLEEQYQALKKKEHFDLTRFILKHSINCSEFFYSCIALVFPLDCCSIFKPVLTTNGLCFYLADYTGIHKILKGLSTSFSLILDLITPPAIDQRSHTGFRLYLTDPSDETLVFGSAGQDIIPGHGTTIKARLIKRQRTALHTPWHSLWNTCPRWRWNATYDSDRYSSTICERIFLENMMRQKCKCELIFHSGPRTLKICEPEDMYYCYFKVVLEKNLAAISDLEATCKPPCIVYSFKSESSYMGVGGDEEISRVDIMYEALQYTYNEYRKPTLSSLFSQIGGSLGLYLGASIITLVEILTFATTWVWYRLVPARDTGKVQQTRRTPLFTARSGHHHSY